MSDKNNIPVFEAVFAEIDGEKESDKKLALSIKFMRDALDDGKKARFGDFWRMKKISLELFKNDIHPTKRAFFWTDYTTLLARAHELQRILEDETNFQVEQIDLAVRGLEKEWDSKDLAVAKVGGFEFQGLAENLVMQKLCQELYFMESLRSRILDLRGDLLSLEMRISLKNKMLERLSSLGDLVFPKRKQLIVEIGQVLSSEVALFIEENFVLEKGALKPNRNIFSLREKTKQLQLVLKNVNVTNEVYRRVRSQLSQAWEILTEADRLRKLEKEKASKEEAVFLADLLERSNGLVVDETLMQRVKGISEEMQAKKVSREVYRKVRLILDKKVALFESALRKEEEVRKEKEEISKLEASRVVDAALEELEKLLPKIGSMEFSEVATIFDEKKRLLSKEGLEKRQMIRFEHLLVAFEDEMLVLEVSQSEDSEIEAVLEKRLSLRNHLKGAIQRLREEITNVGLDFALALELRSIVDSSKARLEEMEERIEVLHQKLS